MDSVLALQYRRRFKRLQIIVLPWSFDVSGAALLRFSHANDRPEPTKGWRIWPIFGQPLTMKINGLDDFEADSSMKELFESAWMRPEGLRLEAKGFVDTRGWDMGDLVGERVPLDLLTRIGEQVDNWV